MLRQSVDVLYAHPEPQRFWFRPTAYGQLLSDAPVYAVVQFYSPNGDPLSEEISMNWDPQEYVLFVEYDFDASKFPLGSGYRATILWRATADSQLERADLFFDVVRTRIVPLITTRDLKQAEPLLEQDLFTTDDKDLSVFVGLGWDELACALRGRGVRPTMLLMSAELAPVHLALSLKYALSACGHTEKAEFWAAEARRRLDEVLTLARVDYSQDAVANEGEHNLKSVEVRR